ncbi:MAG TPA: alpha-amylase family protein [Candidatus Limnocylindrales bacterium]|nr:alpha-amylase family protein [Candidatus Limnocylindrales bacterium]
MIRNVAAGEKTTSANLPWYRRVTRWGQTNITEIDPQQYDIAWWRKHWRRTQTQGVIINAGGIVAYYPSAVSFHHPAEYLNGRDLFGEVCRAAHEDGLVVFARMDSNRAHVDLFQAHPDWFARDAAGNPQKAAELFVACVNSPYYVEHIPAILREIATRYHPEGFTDNSWSGPGRSNPCFCHNCERRFRERSGQELPREKNWNDPAYREWIQWNYERRLELWDFNNRITREAGGADCLWVGMNSGSITGQCQSFRDLKEICRRAEIIMLDHQSRSDSSGFHNNAETGQLIHGLLGWDKLIPESMAMYQAGRPTFRLASKPEPEARLWMLEGIAGGLQPWWHHISAYHEDGRMYRTAEPIYRWHQAYEQFLVNRQPIATLGVVWSQRNTDFYGRDDPDLMVELPWRGLTQALTRARIPYLPVHADEIGRSASQFSALALPNLATMSETQIQAVRNFVQRGGGLLATGQTSLFDEWGQARPDFALADLFGTHIAEAAGTTEAARKKQAAETNHTYLRLIPELRAGRDGPHYGNEPPITGARHPVLKGFEDTDILPFGGTLEPIRVEKSANILMTFVPQFPIYPPETAWMREPKTDIAGVILNTLSGGSRSAFLPADLDRRYGRDHLPDHANLLANLVRWVARSEMPLVIEGPGLIDCHLYRQPQRVILHLVNLTNTGTWRQPTDELLPVGPLRVSIKLPEGIRGRNLRLLVSGGTGLVATGRGWSRFEIKSILDHEVAVLS